MKPHSLLTFDFETKGIQPQPDYPPEPVGVALRNGAGKGEYIAWGHPEGNGPKGSRLRAATALRRGWSGNLLCHHAAFDIAVAHHKLRLPLPDGSRINDTMFLAFLLDPFGDLSLKPLAERYLGMPPTERDRVRDYLYTNRIIKRSVKKWGAHISEAPGDLVGTYAVGDIDRTQFLYDHLKPLVIEQEMWGAYRRECDLVPMLLDNSAKGIPLDHERLKRDTEKFEHILTEVDFRLRVEWEKTMVGAPPENFDSPDELAAAIEQDPRLRLPRTPTGKRSTAKEALHAYLPDNKVKGLLLYRSAIEQCLSGFMRPWCRQGDALHCNWNQVRNYDDKGARTGRLSSSPNFQNITNPEKYDEVKKLLVKLGLTDELFEFPNLRSYIVAPPGYILFSRDYSQQELRLLAHFEDGTLAQAYRDDPDMDVHDYVQTLLHEVCATRLERKAVKTVNFSKIYGAGGPHISQKLGVPLEVAYNLLAAYDYALPGVRQLGDLVRSIGRSGECVITLGGRRYFSPPPTRDEFGGVHSNEYKLLNHLIQGSAADQTKEAMRLWWNRRLHKSRSGTRFLLTVHDQLVGMCKVDVVQTESQVLDKCMRDAFTLDVPVRTDATYGFNFGEMTKAIPTRRR